MNPIGYGIDLSKWQNPETLPWESYRGKVDFVIARACYGIASDPSCAEHVRHAREIGAAVGCYAFYRPSQPVDEQFRTFVKAMTAAGIAPGDIVPALDVEADRYPTLQPVTPAWSEPVKEFAERLEPIFGRCLIYQTHREWVEMGSPAWTLEHPLWVAHYTAAAAPVTPGGRPATVWQHRVGVFDPNGPGGSYPVRNPQIDQNRLLAPLPRIALLGLTDEDRARIEGSVALTTAESADAAFDAARKA